MEEIILESKVHVFISTYLGLFAFSIILIWLTKGPFLTVFLIMLPIVLFFILLKLFTSANTIKFNENGILIINQFKIWKTEQFYPIEKISFLIFDYSKKEWFLDIYLKSQKTDRISIGENDKVLLEKIETLLRKKKINIYFEK